MTEDKLKRKARNRRYYEKHRNRERDRLNKNDLNGLGTTNFGANSSIESEFYKLGLRGYQKQCHGEIRHALKYPHEVPRTPPNEYEKIMEEESEE